MLLRGVCKFTQKKHTAPARSPSFYLHIVYTAGPQGATGRKSKILPQIYAGLAIFAKLEAILSR